MHVQNVQTRYDQSTKAEIAAQEEQLETAKKRLNKNAETKARADALKLEGNIAPITDEAQIKSSGLEATWHPAFDCKHVE